MMMVLWIVLVLKKRLSRKRKDSTKPFNRSGGDCKEEAFLYIFENKDNSNEKHQIIPTTINDAFRIEKADINKDGTVDLYGFREGYFNPWSVCSRPQLNSIYLNKNNEYFVHASSKLIEEKFWSLWLRKKPPVFLRKTDNITVYFWTTPNEKVDVAYIGIENYTGKFLSNKTDIVNIKRQDTNNKVNDEKDISEEFLSIVSILNNVNPLNKTGVNSFKPMLKPVYFDSLGINLTGAKLITFEKDYVMYEGLFNYKEIEFSITLCAQYWEEHKL